MSPYELSNSVGSYLTKVAVSKLELHQGLVGLLQNSTKFANTIAIELAIGYVEIFNFCVGFEYWQHDQEVIIAYVIFTQVERLDSFRLGESLCEVLYSKTVIKELIKCGLEKLLLVLHLDVKYFSLIDISETNHIL